MPGGFGTRGTGGMIAAAEYARRTGTPYFGICYGFQWAVTEYARNVCGLAGANSTEVDPDAPHKIIYKLQDLLGVEELGGTMRLGAYPCQLKPGSRAAAIYGAAEISERHRHRYEFNQAYLKPLEDKGLRRLRQDARRQVRRDRGAARPPLVRRRAVPPGVQVAAARRPTRCSATSSARATRTVAAGARPASAPRRRARAARGERRPAANADERLWRALTRASARS